MTDPVLPADLVPDAGDWAEAVRLVRSHYPEDVSPAFSTSTDARSGTFARHLCDLIQQTAYGLAVDRQEEPQSIAERHLLHYRSCNCLGDKAICCDPTCPCHTEHSDGADHASE